ncbi:MAG TPA: PIN domain-containing protein [Thermoanaerobaculia bacterium]|nr:PIN domain-containing protein [Thermoanaerobaculia bacterium]
MSLLVDTSVWSLALRRDAPDPAAPEIERLRGALSSREAVYTTGLVLQELLQGFSGPRQHEAIVSRFAALPLVVPDRRDHIEAAGIRNTCRRKGVQLGTIDALLAQLAIRHELVLLTTDGDFTHAARHVGLEIWGRR